MKQHISKEQVLGLNDKQYVGLLNALYNTNHKVENLSRGSAGCDFVAEGSQHGYFTSAMETRTNIGKMIEILELNLARIEHHACYNFDWEIVFADDSSILRDGELCDTLFDAIKEIL